MPAIVTHNTFGDEAYELIDGAVGTSKDCIEAFLLGNQGPDPLFYAVADPSISEWNLLGTTMHRERTEDVLAAFRSSLVLFSEREQAIAKAYALGFMCHYLLDCGVHPLVYAQQFALCDAGVPGLTRKDGSDVHATIECEFDEVVVCRYLHTDLRRFNPSKNILRADSHVLGIISTMYLYVALTVFGQVPPADLFKRSVRAFRASMTLFYSRNGIKRRLIVRAEERFRETSMFGSLSMRARPRPESIYENAMHDVWIDPTTKAERTESFDDLFAATLARVKECTELFLDEGFDAKAAQAITHGLNFNGMPVGGALVTES